MKLKEAQVELRTTMGSSIIRISQVSGLRANVAITNKPSNGKRKYGNAFKEIG